MALAEQYPSCAEPPVSRLISRAILVAITAMLIIQTAKFSGFISIGEMKTPVDFHAFHVVGQMVWRGEINQAYHYSTMLRAQRLLGGGEVIFPWAYPPQFNLVIAPLAFLPIGLAYLFFTAGTLAAYLLVLRRMAAQNFAAVLLAIFPSIIVTIACGQNGFLSGALMGLACAGFLRHGPSAGVPLGLMVIKPHLTAGLVLYAFATRRWSTIAVAAAIVLLSATLATCAFGPSVWFAFRDGASEARVFLEEGLYKHYRMISVYAVMRSLGLSATVALAGQGTVALLVLGMVWVAIRRRMPQTRILGLAALASLLVSPYAYDYDLPIFGIALALLMPDLLRLTSRREQAVLLGLSWLTCASGLAQTDLAVRFGASRPADDLTPLALAGATLALLTALVWRVLQREVAAPSEALPLPRLAPRHELGPGGPPRARQGESPAIPAG